MAKPQQPVADAEAVLLQPDADQPVKNLAGEIQNLVPRNGMRLEWWSPRKIAGHDMNWKTHPSLQREAYLEFRQEVGWAGAVLFNETTNRLLDGHMRLQDALENNLEELPVLVITVDRETELKILALLDQIGSMYDQRQQALKKLAEVTTTRSELLRRILRHGAEIDDVEEELPGEGEIVTGAVELPPGGISLVLGEAYDYVVLLFRREIDFVGAQDHFGIKEVKCAFNNGVGLGRVIDGSEYLSRIQRELRVTKLGSDEKQ